MADRINIDTQLLEELSGQIFQLQRSLSGVDTRLSSAISDVRRSASDQTGIINRLNNSRKKLVTTSDRMGKLARAVNEAANRWEEAERKITSQEMPQMSDASGTENGEPLPDGTIYGEGGWEWRIARAEGDFLDFDLTLEGSRYGTEQGDWLSAIEDFYMRNTSASRHQQDYRYRAGQILELIYHWIRGEEYSSGSINEFKIHGERLGVECDISAWNNDYVGLHWQEVEIGGVKQRMLVPYISYGQGVDVDSMHGGLGIENQDGSGAHVEGSIGDVYIGTKSEIGFKNGEFVMHLGGGASATLASVGVGGNNQYTQGTVVFESESAGADVQIDYEGGVLSIEGLISVEKGVGVDLSFNVGKYVNDLQEAVNDFTHGNYISGSEKLWELYNSMNSPGTVNPNPISTLRSML